MGYRYEHNPLQMLFFVLEKEVEFRSVDHQINEAGEYVPGSIPQKLLTDVFDEFQTMDFSSIITQAFRRINSDPNIGPLPASVWQALRQAHLCGTRPEIERAEFE